MALRVAILVFAFPPRWLAGTEIATYRLAGDLAKRGHEIHVFTPLDDGLRKEAVEQGFNVHRVTVAKPRLARSLSFWVGTTRRLRKTSPDVVLAQGTDVGVCALLAKVFTGQPYVVWARGSDVYGNRLLSRSLTRLVLRKANAAIALTEDMKRQMQKLCMRDVFVIPNALDVKTFGDSARAKLDLAMPERQDCKVIIFVGTLRKVKGVEYLIRAMRIVALRRTGVRLVLVGDGEERPFLEDLTARLSLSDIVTFVGRIPNERVPDYLTAAHVFVLPSLSEGFPGVILEAMACGLPIVSTRVGGLPEIVEDGKNGFLVESRSPDEIAEKVILLLEDDSLRTEIADANRKKVERYSPQAQIERLEGILGDVAAALVAGHGAPGSRKTQLSIKR